MVCGQESKFLEHFRPIFNLDCNSSYSKNIPLSSSQTILAFPQYTIKIQHTKNPTKKNVSEPSSISRTPTIMPQKIDSISTIPRTIFCLSLFIQKNNRRTLVSTFQFSFVLCLEQLCFKVSSRKKNYFILLFI